MRGLIPVAIISSTVALFFGVAGGAAPNAPADVTELAAQARTLLLTHCYRCHGKDGANEGGLNFVLRRDKLVTTGKYLVPHEPGKSRLYQRLADHSMPPETEGAGPGKKEIDVFRNWILAGAPDLLPPEPQRRHLALAEVFRLVREDLEQVPVRERRHLRYFTLTHLSNAGCSEDELQSYRLGLAKLINSLSWGRRIENPVPIDPARTILRIDLRHYQWTEQTWEDILAGYPYALVPTSPEARGCAEVTRSRLPLIRADWFVAAAAVPPLYEKILNLPGTDRELELQLRVPVEANIRQERVARAAFNASGISRNNRLIERHESLFGAYWKSYDFATGAGRGNLFAYPLGPGRAGKAFRHDGGEIIFSLPNGLHGFMIVNAEGQKISKAPANVVSDPKQPDRAVVNGLSCMSCHTRGIIPKNDQVREFLLNNPRAFLPAERESIEALYPENEEFAALQKKDSREFTEALAKTGIRPGRTEPILALAQRFEAALELTQAAAEVDSSPEAFLATLEGTPSLARTLGTLKSKGGTVQREVFTEAFRDAVRELKLGTLLPRGTVGNVVTTRPLVPMPPAEPVLGTPPTHTVPFVSTLNDPILSADRRWLYVLDVSAGEIRRVNTKTFEIDTTLAKVTEGTEQMRLSPDGKFLYTCAAPNGHDYHNANKGGKFQVIDAETLAVRETITTPFSPWDMACDDKGLLYVTVGGGQSTFIPVIDTRKKAVVAEWLKGFWHRTLIRITPDQKKLYTSITDLSPPSVSGIPLSGELTPSPKNSSSAGGGGKFSILPDGKMLILASGAVMRLSHTPEGDLKNSAGIAPHLCLATDKGSKRIFVATADKKVKVYSYPDFEVVGTLPTRDIVYRMAYDEPSGMLYCASSPKPLSGRLALGVGDLQVYDVKEFVSK